MSTTPTTKQWALADFFALRTPLLPADELLRWAEGLSAAAATDRPEALAEALASDRARLRERLRVIVSRPEVREALFVASPSLDDSLPLWFESPDSERGLKIERSIVRYLQRMAARCTPFGLFAGTSVGACGEATRLRLAARSTCRRHTRLDMGYVSALAESLERAPGLKEALTYSPNSSLYTAAGRVRFHESRWKGRRILRLIGAEWTEYLGSTLERATRGATFRDLAAPLVGGDITLDDAQGFITELIDSQVLVSDLLPTITGPEPTHGMAELLRRCGQVDLAARLDESRERVAEIDHGGLVYGRERYSAVVDLLKGFPVELDLARLFQVDMFKPTEGALLGEAVAAEVLRGIDVLRRMQGGEGGGALAAFQKAFVERYGDAEVPLLEALDEEAGIGYEKSSAPGAEASPLLAGLQFPPVEREIAWRREDTVALRKLEQALAGGLQEVELREADLEGLEAGDKAPLPDSFAAFATVYAPSIQAVAEGRFRVHLKHASGPSGLETLGRFCHLDAELLGRVRDHLRKEEGLRPEVVFAEVVHLPPDRIGNVIARPILRDHEIPFLGRSAVAPERQIPVTDLRVSVRDGRVVLRSRRLGREVLPRMTNAHNVRSTGLGVYQFLAHLGYQGSIGGMSWSWGALDSARFLPRVTSGRVILSMARWLLDEKELAALAVRRGAESFGAVQALRRARGLPRFVAVEDGDNTLPVDLDNVLSVETFVQLVGKRPWVHLIEMPIGPEDLCAEGPEGRFTHELVVPFVRTGPPPAAARPTGVVLEAVSDRKAAPGGPWLFAKLYCGTSTADRVLRDVARPVSDLAMKSGAADGWFFLRYGDPDWHLRVRFHGAPERLLGEVFPALRERAAPLIGDGSIRRFQLDTYDREVERYGGAEGVVLCERAFHADSEAVLSIVELLTGDEGLDARWRLTLIGMDMLLEDLGLDAVGKLAVMERISAAFRGEFRVSGALDAQIGQKLRQERRVLEAMLDPQRRMTLPIAPGVALLQRRSAQIRPVVEALRVVEREGRLLGRVEDLAPSLLHMHANRLLRSAVRAQEMVLYELLARLYRSAKARGGKAGA